MSSTPVPPNLTGVARSKLILAAGFSASASILAIWLLIWLIFFQTHLRILAFASDRAGASLPTPLTFQHSDAKETTARDVAGEFKPLPAASPGELIPSLAAHLRERQGQTSVVYLASPALGSFGASPEVVLAPVDVFRHVIKDEQLPGATLREILDVFKQARGKRLLILDIGRSRADCDPGAFGDDVVAELERLARPPAKIEPEKYAAWQREWAGFVILCSNASGQWTWTSDADGRSVFGHFVAEGLRRGGEVGDLLRSVPAQVYRWVADQRGGAIQTPIVLGDRSVSFHLPVHKDRPADEPDPRQGELAKATRDWLARHHRSHASYERGGLPGLDPIAWRDYRQAWLLAERFFRAGQITEARRMLAQADAKEAPFKAPGEHDWPSLELSRLVANGKDRPVSSPSRDKATDAIPGPPPSPGAPIGGDARIFEDYAEGQPRRFATTYDQALRSVGREPDPGRTPLVEQALRVRRLAEEATSAAPGGHPWIDRLIAEGGSRRREALDVLFSEARREPVATMLQQAERKYDDALKIAKALNLSNQVAADLPFLGAWLIRSQEPDRDRLVKIAEAARTLASSLAQGRSDRGEPPVGRLKKEADALSREFSGLQKRFQDAAVQASQSESWRLVDEALAVPSIDPGLRDQLVNRSIDPTLSVALRPPVAPKGAEGESAGMGLVRQGLNSGITVRDLGRKGYDALSDRSRDVSLSGPAPEVRPDPSFALHQAGLALLEWCLLTIGGLDDKNALQPLLHPAEAPGGIARSARLARTRLWRQAPRLPGTDQVSLAAWERIRLAMPATTLDASDGISGDQGSARWSRLVLRCADILREDGDAKLAGKFLEGLPERERETEEAKRVAQGVEALARPIELDSKMTGSSVLDGGSPAPVSFTVQAPAGYPHGRSALLLGQTGGLQVSFEAPNDLVEIGERPASTPGIEVHRGDLLNNAKSQASITPVLFFRGQRIAASAIPFELPVVQAEFDVHFVTRLLAGHRTEMSRKYHIDANNIIDQLGNKPRDYYLYRGAETALDAVLKYTPATGKEHPGPRRVFASASFDGKPLAVALKGSKDKARVVEIKGGQELTFEIGDIDTSDPMFRTRAEGSSFRFEIKAGDGDAPVLLSRQVKFREISPDVNYVATAHRSSPNEVTLTVRRSRNDPISMVVGVAAHVGGGQGTLQSIQYEKNSRLNKENGDRLLAGDQPTNQAILFREETATFRFAVPPQAELNLKAEIINKAGRSPWPLVVNPDKIPAMAIPRSNRPAKATQSDEAGAGPDNPGP